MSARIKSDPLTVKCPVCEQRSGFPCVRLRFDGSTWGPASRAFTKMPHPARYKVARMEARVNMNGGRQLDMIELLGIEEPPF